MERKKPKAQPKPGPVLGFQPTNCKFCGHRYWEPCATEAAAGKCRNVKLKKGKAKK